MSTSVKKNIPLLELDRLPLLDINEALMNMSQDSALLKTVLTSLTEHILPADLHELKQHHDKNNWVAIGQVMHRMRGGLMYCGTPRLVRACQYLEDSLMTTDQHNLQGLLYEQLCEVLDHTCILLREWLELCHLKSNLK